MKYILIDTNTWIVLLHEENETDLSTLEYWVAQGKVILLIPQALSLEWERQKKIQFNLIIKTQSDALPKLKSFRSLVKLEQDYIEQRVQRIDELFRRGKIIKPTNSVQAEVTKRATVGKAPFHHRNNNSISDSLILLTSLNFIKKTKEKSLVFITNDVDDFSNPNNRDLLHEDFNSGEIKIIYFTNIGKGINTLKDDLGNLPFLSANQKREFIPIFYLVSNQEDIPLIDKIHNSLTKYQDQLSFIPTNILTRIYPFKIEDAKYDYSYHSAFQINSNNIELVQLFKDAENLKTDKSKLSESKFGLTKKSNREKLKGINKILNNNLIFSINSVDNRLEAGINASKNKICNCVLCTYNRFDFLSSFSQLSLLPLKDERETMKHAYVHFQFGNFIQSIKLFYDAYTKSEKQKKYLRAFICLHNIKRLKQYINGYYTKIDPDVVEILKNIEKINFEDFKFITVPDPFVKENIEWIVNKDFFNEAHQNIVKVITSITDHYYNQLSGGRSTNSNFHILLSEFAELESFLDHNNIIYNNFSEFEETAGKFLEGIFMIHSFDEIQSQRLSVIDESLILLIARFSKREIILKYYNRLHLSSLKYRLTSGEKSIVEVFLKVIADYKKLKTTFGHTEELNNFFFWEKYKRMFSNLLLFIALSDSTDIDYDTIFAALIKILPEEKFLRKFDENIIADFLHQKGNIVKSETIKKFMLLAIDNNKLHEGIIFNSLKNQISKYHPSLVIRDKKTYKLILQNFLKECPKCKQFHDSEILVSIFFILSDRLKKDLISKVKEKLMVNFLPDLYYKFAIHDIIDYREFFDKYLENSPPKQPRALHPLNYGIANYFRLSEILNLAFKFNRDISAHEFQKYKGISNYYDWLLDMNNFDYSKFDPKWILAYPTESYLTRIFKNEKIRDHVKEYLKKHKHPKLSEFYIAYS